jgi:hypothetical protein
MIRTKRVTPFRMGSLRVAVTVAAWWSAAGCIPDTGGVGETCGDDSDCDGSLSCIDDVCVDADEGEGETGEGEGEFGEGEGEGDEGEGEGEITQDAPCTACGSWDIVGELPGDLQDVALAGAAAFADGRVVIAYTRGASSDAQSYVRIFDPDDGSFETDVALLPEDKTRFAYVDDAPKMVLLEQGPHAGDVLIGAAAGEAPFDTDVDTLSGDRSPFFLVHGAGDVTVVTPPEVRAYTAFTVLDDGRVLLAGGCRDTFSETGLRDAWIWDGTDFANIAAVPLGKLYHLLLPLPNGAVLTGGNEGSNTGSTYDFVYDADADEWTDIGISALYAGDPIVTTPGDVSYAFRNGIERFDPGVGSWDFMTFDNAPGLSEGVEGAAPVGDAGEFLLLGSDDVDGTEIGHAVLFDAASLVFTPVARMNDPRHFMATVASAGRVLVLGGADKFGNAVTSIEAFTRTP